MRVALIYNPLSGRGRGPIYAKDVARAVEGAGLGVQVIEVGPAAPKLDVARAIEGAGACVVIGGDGTVRSTASAAIAAQVPMYHYATGTENLVARYLRMRRDPRVLGAFLERRRRDLEEGVAPDLLDIGSCNGMPFLIMASVGPDASVVHRLARVRKGRISRASYAPHTVAELVRPTMRPLTVRADGEVVVDGRRGMVVVSNLPMYAAGAIPSRDADPRDGLVDVCFFPGGHPVALLPWVARTWMRNHQMSAKCIRVRGARVEVEGEGMPFQIDGEAMMGEGESSMTPMVVTVERQRLPILHRPEGLG